MVSVYVILGHDEKYPMWNSFAHINIIIHDEYT